MDFSNPNSNQVANITSLKQDQSKDADITTVIYDAEATDPDGDTLTYSVSGTDASVEVDSDDGEIRLLNQLIMRSRTFIHLM